MLCSLWPNHICVHSGHSGLVCPLWPEHFGVHSGQSVMVCLLWPRHNGVHTVAKCIGVPTVAKT
jgi:hypothetical protein